MQIDMHYHGTYAMARAAGMRREAAVVVATCAQLVDDANDRRDISLADGSSARKTVCAHKFMDQELYELETQRTVWVPFHFLPGNEGDGFSQRMLCRENSAVAQDMMLHVIHDCADKRFILPLLGVATHVFEDTFSHYDFSGLSSHANAVDGDSIELEVRDSAMRDYLVEKYGRFMARYDGGRQRNWYDALVSGAVEFYQQTRGDGVMGHGGVATYPDRPYLVWRFAYEQSGRESVRNNPQTYLNACESLHRFYTGFLDNRRELRESGGREFGDIRAQVLDVLRLEAACEGREQAWLDLMASGTVTGVGEPIPEYAGEEWITAFDAAQGQAPEEVAFRDLDAFDFFKAARYLRTYILDDLLPQHGLHVI